jgi:hypothetical protein
LSNRDRCLCTCAQHEPLSTKVWLTVPEAATYSTLSVAKVYEYVAAELLPSAAVGGGSKGNRGRRVIRRADLDRFLEDRITNSNVARLSRRRL